MRTIEQPRDTSGRFGEKPQSNVEVALFPAEWSNEDFPHELPADPFVGDVDLADKASWPTPPF